MGAESRKNSSTAAPEWSNLESVLGVVGDWAWEQDTDFCFTQLTGHVLEGDPELNEQLLGSARWDLGLYPIDGEGSWESHRELLAARLPFRRLILRRELPDGGERFICISGAPSFDENGYWSGYRGIGEDVSESQERYHAMQRFGRPGVRHHSAGRGGNGRLARGWHRRCR